LVRRGSESLVSVDILNLDRDIALIKKRRGNVIGIASEEPPITRIPLESPVLMRITSGGIPLGRITRIFGGPSSGKTLASYGIINAAHNLRSSDYPIGLECCYYDIEQQFSVDFAKSLGIATDRLIRWDGQIIEDVATEMEKLLGSIHVHVLDSISEALPMDRFKHDPSEWGGINLKIRSWEKAWEYIMRKMDKSENAIIAISHVTKTGNDRKSEKALDGKEIEHLSGLSIQMKQTKWLYYDEEGFLQTEDKLKEKGILGIAGQREADGQEIVVRVTKSRVCKPFRIGHMRLDLNTFKFDHTFELMEGAEYFDKWGNVAHRSGQPAIAHRAAKQGGWVTLPSGEKIQGERALRQIIEADKDLQNLIRRAMLAGQ
jgi:RecA/RadA recombinase